MAMHPRCDDTFVQTDEWYAAEKRYREFVEGVVEKPTVLLELGVGWNTPVWIRMPFECLSRATKSPLIRMNYDDAFIDPSLSAGISLEGDIAETLPEVPELQVG